MRNFHPELKADESKIDEPNAENSNSVAMDNDKACGTSSSPESQVPPAVEIVQHQQERSPPRVAAVSGVIQGNKIVLTVMLPGENL